MWLKSLFLVGLLVGATVSSMAYFQMPIVKEGKPKAVIIIGEKATSTERHAAEELVKYIKEMSGAELEVKNETAIEREGNIILIGRPETNLKIKEFCDKGLVKLSSNYPGLDGFIIKTLHPQHPACNYLILGGSRDRGTLYAIYHLLEKYCQVGFFWDGDRVHKMKTINLPEIDVVERPYFEIRWSYAGCGCADTYSFGTYWDFDMWKQEIDWLAKNKFNQIMLPPPEKPITRKIMEYLKELDLESIVWLPFTEVSEEFKEQHPEGSYFQVGWWDITPPKYHLYPTDPLYIKRVEEFIDNLKATIGTHHNYMVAPWCEAKFLTTDEERKKIQIELPKGLVKAIKSADPKGIWYLNGWAWVADAAYWPKETMKAFFDAIDTDDCLVIDHFCDVSPVYNTDFGNYFYGKKWCFNIIHNFGGDDKLFGDIYDLNRRVQAVLNDPRANRCIGFGLMMEVLRYDILYYDFATKLAWNPKSVDIDKFIDDYTLRRYGKEAFPKMKQAARLLVDAVYSSVPGSEGRYQHRFYPEIIPYQQALQSLTIANKLKQVLSLSLDARKLLEDNRLYQNDLVDIIRQYVTELFNLHYSLLNLAFSQGDIKNFNKEARVLDKLLKGLEKVLSSRADYRIEDIVKRLASEAPQRSEEISRFIRDSGLTFAASLPAIIDYQSKDLYELVKFYYHKRLKAYIGYLRERLRLGESGVSNEELNKLYREIELQWVNEGYDPKDAEAYKGSMVDAVEEVFQRLLKDKEVELSEQIFKPQKSLLNGDFEEGLGSWYVGVVNGEVKPKEDNKYSGRKSLYIKLKKEDVPKHTEVYQIISSPKRFTISLAYYIVAYTKTANINLRVDGFNKEGKKVIQAVYYWGGENWDWWDAWPEQTGGFWSIKRKLPTELNKWLILKVDPSEDINRSHGKGIWESQGVTTIVINIGAWAYEKEENYIEGYIDDINLQAL